jgi:hypothetical protein
VQVAARQARPKPRHGTIDGPEEVDTVTLSSAADRLEQAMNANKDQPTGAHLNALATLLRNMDGNPRQLYRDQPTFISLLELVEQVASHESILQLSPSHLAPFLEAVGSSPVTNWQACDEEHYNIRCHHFPFRSLPLGQPQRVQ